MSIMSYPTYQVYSSARRRNLISNKIEFSLRNEADIRFYVTKMNEAIIVELEQRAHCWLIDSAFATGHISSLDWSILKKLCSVQGNSDYVLNCTSGLEMLPITEKMEEIMLSLHQRKSMVPPNSMQGKHSASSDEVNGLQRQLEQARLEKDALDKQITELHKEAARLQLEQQEMQNSIRQQLNDAQREAQSIRENAENLRSMLLQGVALETTKEAYAAPSDDGVLKDKVERETLRLETTIRTTFESYRDEIHKMLYDFRTGLYKADYDPLCLAYQRLSLFATNTLDKRIDDLCKSFDDEAFSAHLQGELRKLQGQLLRRVTALEDGFRKLGLIVYRPEPGETYNDVFHAAENAEDDGYLEATVRCCICPGFRTDEQVLCRAAVIVNPITQD